MSPKGKSKKINVGHSITRLTGRNSPTTSKLVNAGFSTMESVAAVSVEELTSSTGMDEKTVQKLIEVARETLRIGHEIEKSLLHPRKEVTTVIFNKQYEIKISWDFKNRRPQALLKIPEHQIIDSIQNPEASESLTYFGMRLDLFLKCVNSNCLLVFARVDEKKLEIEVCRALIIPKDICYQVKTDNPVDLDLIEVREGKKSISEVMTALRIFLEQFGLPFKYQRQNIGYMLFRKEILHITSIPPHQDNLWTINPFNHEIWENTLPGIPFNGVKENGPFVSAPIFLQFCINLTQYLTWLESGRR